MRRAPLPRPQTHHAEPAMPDDSPRKPPTRSSAVALRYDTNDAAPRVVAKGYGTLADTIIRTAQAHGLYVHNAPELVGLLQQVDLDAHIPPQLYVVVAELLAWLYGLEGAQEAA